MYFFIILFDFICDDIVFVILENSYISYYLLCYVRNYVNFNETMVKHQEKKDQWHEMG